jgi:hypothetical protein
LNATYFVFICAVDVYANVLSPEFKVKVFGSDISITAR